MVLIVEKILIFGIKKKEGLCRRVLVATEESWEGHQNEKADSLEEKKNSARKEKEKKKSFPWHKEISSWRFFFSSFLGSVINTLK